MVGFDGSDIVQIGNFRCISRMAFATKATSADFDVVDGILGWGFTEVFRNPALLYTMSTPYRAVCPATPGQRPPRAGGGAGAGSTFRLMASHARHFI
jgi:hypothetical protein